MKLRNLFLVVLVAFLIAACQGDLGYLDEEENPSDGTIEPDESGDLFPADGTVEPADSEAYFEEDNCPIADIDGVQLDCGYLIAPENRYDPGNQNVELAVAVLRVVSDPEPDPLVYLAGGPGGSAIDELDGDPDIWITLAENINRDLIFIDQRGTGYSYPSLDCPELDEYEDEVDGAEACHDRLVDEGVDLTAYNSAESAADLEDLRNALGYEEWNLLGVSYGTRLALTAMRDYPNGLRAVILDSTYPPNVDSAVEEAPNLLDALRALFAACAADATCDSAYPDLESVLLDTVADLNDSPATIEVEDPDSGEVYDQDLYGDDVVNTLTQLLYDSEILPAIPRLIYEVAGGDYANYSLLIADYGLSRARYQEEDVSDSEGMNYSVQCNEEFPFADEGAAESTLASEVPVELQEALYGGVASYFEVCPIWGAGEGDPIEDEPVYSDIPTLVLAGAFDPVTPPRWGEIAASTLDNAFYYLFPAAGHAVFDDNLCAMDVLRGFLDDPQGGPDESCVDSLPEIEFILPGDPMP